MGGATGRPHRPGDQIAGAEMVSAVADLDRHGREGTEETGMASVVITGTVVLNGKTVRQRTRQESAASVPSANVWP